MTGRLLALFMLTIFLSGTMVAGSHKGPKVERRTALTGEETIAEPAFRGPYPSTYNLGPGDSIAFTTYDFGTNGSALRNLVNYGDGTLSLVRMGSQLLDPANPDRGSFFSHSTDYGMTWPAFVKVEKIRTGWSNVDQIPDAGGVEVVVSHDFGASNLQFNVDAARGAGVWSSSSAGGSVWPRIAVGSPFTFHVVASFNGNPPTEIVYLRSTDAGASFDIVDQQLFTTSAGVLPDADGQDIAAQGDNVAIVAAGVGGDVGLMTSEDGGMTWTEQVIYDVAGPGELPTGEEQPQPDGSCSVLYDPAGNIHVAWGNFLAVGDASNNPELFFSVDAPIMYWSEATGIEDVAFPLPDTSIGQPAGRGGNYASQPDIAVEANGRLHIIYSSMVDDQDTSGNYFEHVFWAFNGPTTWETLDITPGTGFDASFPSVADLVDENLQIVYNCDPLAGNALQGNHPLIQVAVMFLQSPAYVLDVKTISNQIPERYSLDQNYPNPFNPKTEIGYRITAARSGGVGGETGLVTLTVYDLLGREVATLVNEELAPGAYTASWDAGDYASGVYLYRLEAGSFVQTRRMILMK